MRRVKSGSTIAQRLEYYSMPVPECGCQIWLGTISGRGYGYLLANGKVRRAHRVSWEQDKGPIPDGLQVLHDCDTPCCINSNHLFLGTNQDNVDDKIAKGREARVRGSLHGMAKLSESDVIEIRAAVGLQKNIAAKFGVGQQIISRIRSRKLWRHL